MKKILFTQRVDVIESYQERRDCADQSIASFIDACGYLPIPVPNNPKAVSELLKDIEVSGIVFSGGNNLMTYGGDAPERDETERILLKHAIQNKIPVYGFCRGMQFILDYFGYPLTKVQNHVAVKHEVNGTLGKRIVNSYHGYGCLEDQFQKNGELQVLARSNDGVVEAVKHVSLPIVGTMWHPERNQPFEQEDINSVKELMGE